MFGRETEAALGVAAVLVNDGTVGPGGRPGALQLRLRQIWQEDAAGVMTVVNRMLDDVHATLRFVRRGQDYRLLAVAPTKSPADRMTVDIVMAVADLVRAGELSRLRVCDADGCQRVLVDLSKNRSRRYCSRECGNRTHVAAYRARVREHA